MSKLKTEAQYSFERGMVSAARPGTTPAGGCELLVNGMPALDGSGVVRRGGSSQLSSTPLGSGAGAGLKCWGGTMYIKADGTKLLVLFFGTKAYTATLTSGLILAATERASGLTAGWWSLVAMRVGSANYMVCANGGTSVYYWDGTTWGTLSNWPSGIKYLAVSGDRLWGTGHSGETVVGSKVADPSIVAVASGGISLQVATHDGDSTMTGLYALGPVLLVFKRRSVNYIEGFGYRTVSVEAGARGLSRSTGCIAPRSIKGVGNMGVCFLSLRGIEYLVPGSQPVVISGPIQPFMDKLCWARFEPDSDPGLPCSLWWSERQEYWLAVPTGTATQNNYIIRWRPEAEGRPACFALLRLLTLADYTFAEDTVSPTYVAQTNEFASLWVIEGSSLFDDVNAPTYGGFDGICHSFHDAILHDNTTTFTAVEMRVVSRPMLYGDPSARKRARVLSVLASGKASTAVTVYARVQVDGTSGTEKTLTFAASATTEGALKVDTMVGGKGRDIRVHLRTQTIQARISGIALDAEVLREARGVS